MRTTIDIPDETYKDIKRLAIAKNTTVKNIVLASLQLVLKKGIAQHPPKRLKLPMIHSAHPGSLDIDNEKIYDLIGFP